VHTRFLGILLEGILSKKRTERSEVLFYREIKETENG